MYKDQRKKGCLKPKQLAYENYTIKDKPFFVKHTLMEIPIALRIQVILHIGYKKKIQHFQKRKGCD